MTRGQAAAVVLASVLLVSATAPAIAVDGPDTDNTTVSAGEAAADDGIGVGTTGSAGGELETSLDDNETADAVYVTEDGDAILVSEETQRTASNGTWMFGANVPENIVYGQYDAPIEDSDDVTGDLSLSAEPSRLEGEGSLSMPRPETLDEFDLNVTSEATEDDAWSDMTLSTRVGNASGLVRMVDSVTTSGEIRQTPDRFQLSGDLDVATVLPLDQETRYAASVEQTDDTYDLTVEREDVVRGPAVGNWSDRATAEETVRQQVGANESDDNVTVSIDEYALEERGENAARLTLAYTVTYHNAGETLEDSLADSFTVDAGPSAVGTGGFGAVDGGMSETRTAGDTVRTPPANASPEAVTTPTANRSGENVTTPGANVSREPISSPGGNLSGAAGTAVGPSEEDAEALAEALLSADVETARIEYSAESGSYSGNLEVDVGNYGDFLDAYFAYVESMGAGQGADVGVQTARDQLAAQRAADLEQRYTWDGSLTSEGQAMTGDLTVNYRTSNWDDYVSELRDRDVPWVASSSTITGGIDGDRVVVDGSMAMTGEDLWEAMTTGFEQSGANESMAAAGSALSESDPQQAKLDAAFDSDGLTIETAAEFGNLAALRDAMADSADSDSFADVREFTSRLDGDTTRTAVRLDGVLDSDPTTADIRALESVDEESKIHMAGNWSEDEVPTMDTQQAESFLAAQTSGILGPGFGVLAAVLGVLGAALLAARRR